MSCINYIIGRKGDIRLGDQSVSRQHARLQIADGRYYLADLGSSNGTFHINDGKRVRFSEGAVLLNESFAFGDFVITIGQLLEMKQSAGMRHGSMVKNNAGDVRETESPGERKRCINCGRVLLVQMNSCPQCGYSTS